MLLTVSEELEQNRIKREAKEAKKEVIRRFILKKTSNGEVDRWGHIKYQEGNSLYRYKLMENVIRLEIKHTDIKNDTWMRLKSYNFNKVYDLAMKDK